MFLAPVQIRGFAWVGPGSVAVWSRAKSVLVEEGGGFDKRITDLWPGGIALVRGSTLRHAIMQETLLRAREGTGDTRRRD